MNLEFEWSPQTRLLEVGVDKDDRAITYGASLICGYQPKQINYTKLGTSLSCKIINKASVSLSCVTLSQRHQYRSHLSTSFVFCSNSFTQPQIKSNCVHFRLFRMFYQASFTNYLLLREMDYTFVSLVVSFHNQKHSLPKSLFDYKITKDKLNINSIHSHTTTGQTYTTILY